MGGWNIFYGLLNFAILAVALYFIGKKLVVKMFVSRRDRIAEELERAEQAQKKADTLESELAQKRAQGQAQCLDILNSAREEAEKIKENTNDLERHYNEHVRAESEKEKRFFRRALRKQLNRQAAEDIAQAAAAIMAEESNRQARQKLLSAFPEMLAKKLSLSSAELAFLEESGQIDVVLCCADEPDEALIEKVKKVVFDAMRSFDNAAESDQIHFNVETDPELIGGAMVFVNDTVYDGSLSGMLSRVKRELSDSTEIEGDVLETIEGLLRNADRGIDVYQLGHVVSLSDGICHVSGVSDAMYGELLEFGNDLSGLVMDLEKNYVGVALLGNYEHVREGDPVRRSGRIVEVPVGEQLLGRVVDALGRPIDGGDEFTVTQTRPIECASPGVIQRKSVHKPMQTGIKAIDALVPIGRGQRELIIGDRQTGKTSIALDTIINQKGKDMICIYVAIGQKESTVVGLVEKLREKGCMDYTIVVCAAAYESAPMLYIAPYSGTSMGEYFMNKGKDVLIVYDDLSKHAVAYREISLLLHRPPGREAYPGDIFYLHSRLLERAASLADEYGGGSMTALPIVETQAGDISAYIPTNVISITDGQIFLETELFNSGTRPAINVGLSVSRVGGSAQLPAMKQVSGRLRMDLAQYRELAAFSQFGSELDKNTQAVLNRGAHITELLKQAQYAPMEAYRQVIAIFAAGEGHTDNINLADMARYEQQLLEYVDSRMPSLQSHINGRQKLSAEQMETLRGVIKEFNKSFQ